MLLGIIVQLDILISNYVQTLWHPILTIIFTIITHLADVITLSIVLIVLLIYLYKKKEYSKFIFFLSIILLGETLNQLIKVSFQRLRPQDQLVNVINYSFPSGHTTMATVFSLGVFLLFKDSFKDKNYKLFLSLILLYPLLIGLSRIYLNVHWFSDVIIGWVLGIIVTLFIYHYFYKKQIFINLKFTK